MFILWSEDGPEIFRGCGGGGGGGVFADCGDGVETGHVQLAYVKG